MGWSHEYGEVIQHDEEIRRDLSTLVEIGGQCAGHIHTLTLGGVESAQERFILEEKKQLRDRVQVYLSGPSTGHTHRTVLPTIYTSQLQTQTPRLG